MYNPIESSKKTEPDKKVELLSPGGNVEAIKAGIVAGANAVYCGMDQFNARNRATNLSFDELNGVLRLAHEQQCKVFLTINVVILEEELKALFNLLNQLVNTSIDGIIVQDLGLFNIVKKYFPTLDLHASTQLTTHNQGQIKFLSKIGASRLNLSRELDIDEITALTATAHEYNLLAEVFIHGSLCIAFSGQCYSSSVSVGKSGNRGQCSQACRDEYDKTLMGNKYPLNLKDNSAYFDLPKLIAAGVDSLKIEGRIKGAHYVYTVVDSWRKQINSFVASGKILSDDSNLHKVFNRDFTNLYLKGNLNKSMFIDNPRDNSVNYAADKSNAISMLQIQDVKRKLYQDKNALGDELRKKIKCMNIDKIPLSFEFSGEQHQPLDVRAVTSANVYQAQTKVTLQTSHHSNIAPDELKKRFKSFNNANYIIKDFDFSKLGSGLSLPFCELTKLKNEITFLLNNAKSVIPPVAFPQLVKYPKINQQIKLSVLIADEKDLDIYDSTDADIYFKIPESLKKGCTKYSDLLRRNPRLIPWFPALHIGKDYIEAVKLLEQLNPARIVSNNTGIAYAAFEMAIDWIAGPFLNTTNSYALHTLKEELNCSGAFISNEINQMQIRNIKRPEHFKLLYSIYHPILMMTSRQCFFQQIVGCKKPGIDENCMLKCSKHTAITNVKGASFLVDKQKGGYPSIYNHEQFLNIDVVKDFSHLFDEFFIDLSTIGTPSKLKQNKTQLLQHFEGLINNIEGSSDQLNHRVSVSTNAQYQQGL